MYHRQRWTLAATGLTLATLLAGASARADKPADALLREVAAATRAARTLSADLYLTMRYQARGPAQRSHRKGTVRLMKPNYARIEISEGATQIAASDGTTLWTHSGSVQPYTKYVVDARGRNIDGFWTLPISYFFCPDEASLRQWLGQSPPLQTSVLPEETVQGVRYRVVQVQVRGETTRQLKMYIGPDKLVRRVTGSGKYGEASLHYAASLSNVRVDAPMRPADFAFQVPAGAKVLELPEAEAMLLRVGKPAPDFNLAAPGGGLVGLKDALRDKKAVWVNFWEYG